MPILFTLAATSTLAVAIFAIVTAIDLAGHVLGWHIADILDPAIEIIWPYAVGTCFLNFAAIFVWAACTEKNIHSGS